MICMFISISTKAQNSIEKLVVYKSFWRGGTTTIISNIFKTPEKYSIDTTNINIVTDMFLNEFGSILCKSKQKKHFQQKIAEIEVAGEFWLNQSDKHFFTICMPNLLIDITNKKEYIITDELLVKQLKDWINTLKDSKTNAQ